MRRVSPDVVEYDERLIGRTELRGLVPVSDMTIWRWEQAGLFPDHISINGRNYWVESEISGWLDDQKCRRASPAKEETNDAN